MQLLGYESFFCSLLALEIELRPCWSLAAGSSSSPNRARRIRIARWNSWLPLIIIDSESYSIDHSVSRIQIPTSKNKKRSKEELEEHLISLAASLFGKKVLAFAPLGPTQIQVEGLFAVGLNVDG
ncbi:hypothetical protein L1987_18190 [Smallanthus sonchifolius]|uniref:Uncharacterized protein n=1 Tax=Smallanthus sonchifolius TaxID=185202 RepID=A0ACB9IZM8_9ASTR|nr:hypothetical protein L1987_18190 [Smallanthus sonchifolius]